MRKNDPMRRLYWFIFICEGLVLLNLLFQVILSMVVGRPEYWLFGWLIFFVLFLIFIFFVLKRKHQRTEERRERAASGSPDLLAQPQPIPDAQATSLPTKIELHMSIKHLLEFMSAFYVLIAMIMSVTLIILIQTGPKENTPQPGVPTIYISSIAIIGIIWGILFVICLFNFLVTLLLRSLFEQEITLDEQGVTTKFYRKTIQIPWNEVQSFAMWGNAKHFSTIQFEITSNHDVARWFQIGAPRKVLTWLTMLKPNMPYEEYRTKMAAIQQVIVARTGKPLYDLRDEKIVWW